jgi:hypothetical protein
MMSVLSLTATIKQDPVAQLVMACVDPAQQQPLRRPSQMGHCTRLTIDPAAAPLPFPARLPKCQNVCIIPGPTNWPLLNGMQVPLSGSVALDMMLPLDGMSGASGHTPPSLSKQTSAQQKECAEQYTMQTAVGHAESKQSSIESRYTGHTTQCLSQVRASSACPMPLEDQRYSSSCAALGHSISRNSVRTYCCTPNGTRGHLSSCS